MPVQLPGNPDHDWERQAKFDVLSLAIPDPGAYLRLTVPGGGVIAFSAVPATLVFTASPLAVLTVTHGLGTTPKNIQLASVNTAHGDFEPQYDSLTPTTFRLVGYLTGGAATYNQPVSWVALG